MILDLKGYFDFNATTPLLPSAAEAWSRAALEHWQNPSSLYQSAATVSQKLDAARERLASLLDTDAERVVFTSGATESNNLLFAALSRRMKSGDRVAISAIEHPCVREAARWWVGSHRDDELPLNDVGVLEPDTLRAWLEKTGSNAALVSVMAANNESGTLQPWAQLSALCRDFGVGFHSDAAQWIGKLPIVGLGSCDFLTGSGHKFGGSKGTGFLLLPVESDQSWHLLVGGPQEFGRRAGTENYPGVEAMVTALEELHSWDGALEQASHRDEFERRIKESLPELRVIGDGAERLWNTSLVVMPRHSNLKWLARLSRAGFCISTGSACSSGREGSSVVVAALGADAGELRRVLRFSSGWSTTANDWAALGDALMETASALDDVRRSVSDQRRQEAED